MFRKITKAERVGEAREAIAPDDLDSAGAIAVPDEPPVCIGENPIPGKPQCPVGGCSRYIVCDELLGVVVDAGFCINDAKIQTDKFNYDKEN